MRLGHVPVLDGWRGIAILLVLAVHCDRVLTGGWLGVHLFFVLSGFLITALLLDEHRTAGTISFARFYRRRALRLFPALFVMLAVYIAFASLREVLGFGGDLERSLTGVAYGVAYVMNIVMAVSGPGNVPLELQPLWSLGVEEQFYIVWPLLLLALLRFRVGGPWPLLFALGAVIGATGAVFNFTSIAVGCIAGVVFSYGLVRRAPTLLATVAVVPMVVLVVSTEHDYHRTPPILLFTVPTAIVLLACTLSQDWWLPRLVDRRVLRWFGKISYGLYIWHWPLYVAFGWRLGLPLAIGVAVLSYRYVEQPFLRRKGRVVPAAPATWASEPVGREPIQAVG